MGNPSYLLIAGAVILATYLAARPRGNGLAHAALLVWCAGFLAAFAAPAGNASFPSPALWLVIGWLASLAYCGLVLGTGQTVRRLWESASAGHRQPQEPRGGGRGRCGVDAQHRMRFAVRSPSGSASSPATAGSLAPAPKFT